MKPVQLPLGPVMADVASTTLDEAERAMLVHPLIGGVILFARNFESPRQLCTLTADIRALRTPPLLIGVDHEGGRVQRFRDGFTRLPPMRALGRLHDTHADRARELARAIGAVMADELRAHGVDFSFAPVLDLDYGHSAVIGDRALHGDPAVVGELAGAFVEGLASMGMGAVGKHFPGHGHCAADSHVAVPVDARPLAEIERDLTAFRVAFEHGLTAVMPAHVIYPEVDALPAGFSRRWLHNILRGRLGFRGLVFSDDLSMAGAGVAGDAPQRAAAALQAGCDMALVCNQPRDVDAVLRTLRAAPVDAGRVEALRTPSAGSAQHDRRAIGKQAHAMLDAALKAGALV